MNRINKPVLFCFILLLNLSVFSQKIPYGNNPDAGKYFNVGELVSKLIVMGVGDRPQNRQHEKLNYTAEGLMKSDSVFFTSRLKLMPEPQRWQETLSKLTSMYNNDYMSKETFDKIRCPVLLMNGDRDGYSSIDEFIQCAKYISNAQVALIPGCHHVIFFCNFPAVWESVKPFLDQ